jgi:hypothetical protein
MEQEVVVRDVPADKVDAVSQGFTDAGATNVEKTEQPDGKFTLRATFPD